MQLTVGGQDVTAFLRNGATFTEIASSSDGSGIFTLNGEVDAVQNAAPVVMTNDDGLIAWEGQVSSWTEQVRGDGTVAATLVSAAPASALFAVGTSGGSCSNTDVATAAQVVANSVGVPWAGPSAYGLEIGSLSYSSADDALTTLATLVEATWGVRNGSLVFSAPWVSGIASVPVSFSNVVSNAIGSIDLLGGLDASTRVPLAATVIPLGSPEGPTVYVNRPELCDAVTLDAYGAALAEWYGAGSVNGNATLPNVPTVRAGDWLQDQDGIVSVAYSTQYSVVNGGLVLNVSVGFPSLPVDRQYSSAFTEAIVRQPPARLHTDCVVSGCDLSISGVTATMTAGTVILGSSTFSVQGQVLTLPTDGVNMIETDGTQFFLTDVLTAPTPGTALMLYQVTMFGSSLVQQTDVRTFGGVGTMQLKPATPGNPSVTLNSISLSGEGVTNVLAVVGFTVNGVTFDDTIRSIEVSWSQAGKNQWHPPIPAVFAPANGNAAVNIHGLAGGQNYDLGVTVRGHNGVPLNASPMLLGTSPTISSQAINLVLNLDQISDGTTYKRVKASEITNGFVKQLNDGAVIRTAANVAAVVDQNSNVPNSSAWNSTATSMLPFTTDFKLTVVVGGSPAYAFGYYLFGTGANNAGGSGTAVTFRLPDGTVYTPAARGTSGSPINLNNQPNPTTGHTVYFMVYWKNDSSGSDQVWVNNALNSSSANGTGWRVIYQYDNAFSPQSFSLAVADGGYQATLAQASNQASFGGGSGGGGSRGGCPEANQLIEVCRVDKKGRMYSRYVKAKSLVRDNWMAQWVRDPDGGWNAIIREPRVEPCQVWEVTIGGETVRVDASHMFRDAEDDWVNVKDLKPGHRMHYFDRRGGKAEGTAAVESVRCVGRGSFVALHCERERYVLGKTVSHNSKFY